MVQIDVQVSEEAQHWMRFASAAYGFVVCKALRLGSSAGEGISKALEIRASLGCEVGEAVDKVIMRASCDLMCSDECRHSLWSTLVFKITKNPGAGL